MLHTRCRIKEIIAEINNDSYECAEYGTETMTDDDEFFFRPAKSYRRTVEKMMEKEETNFAEQYEDLEHFEQENNPNL